LVLSRMFALLSRELGHFQTGSRGIWQFKTVLGRFKTVVEASGTF